MRCRTLGVLAIGLLALAAILALSGGANAVGGQVDVSDENGTVLPGHSAIIQVTFGVNQPDEDIEVTCSGPSFQHTSSCPLWKATVEFNPNRASCYFEGNQRVCDVDFPNQGFQTSGSSQTADDAGEPSRPGTYHVGVRDDQNAIEDRDTFTVALSTARTCYDGFHRRGENMAVATSGHPAGTPLHVQIVDQTAQQVVFESERTSIGERFSYTFPWRPPLDYPLGRGDSSSFQVRLETGDGIRTEEFELVPGKARSIDLFGPGIGGYPQAFDRTETVIYEIGYVFPPRPPDCTTPPGGPFIPVSGDNVQEPLQGEVYKVTDTTFGQNTELVDEIPLTAFEERRDLKETPDGRFLDGWTRVQFDYVIPRDTEATQSSGNPQYEIHLPETPLSDGNLLAPASSSLFEAHPYTITPDFIEIQEEVERLETAEVVVNLTYDDGSPFTMNDTGTDPIEIEFGPADDELYVFELNHLTDGRWNASVDLDFEHEPLDEYTWRVRHAEDRHGRADARNQIERTVSPIVHVVSARPIIDLETYVDGAQVNQTQRSETVFVSLNAAFKNGVPLTDENIDPSLSGIQLNVKKTNQFGRIIDVDTHVMTPASDQGDWVRSFRLGKSAEEAPAGDWDLEIVARDDQDPPNENATSFPFTVEPADVQISPREIPPPLVDENVDTVHYRFQLNYPDRTHVTEPLLSSDQGGRLQVSLERIQGQDPVLEQVFDPRSRAGGQFWEVSIDAHRLVAGNHYFNVTGQDIHGNPIGPESSRLFTVLFQGELRNSTTPICPPGMEGCGIERGSDVFAVFPGSEGDRGMGSDDPEIILIRQPPNSEHWLVHDRDVRIATEAFENRTGSTGLGDNHVGIFETSESTPEGTYRFSITGRASDDSGFAGFSERFNITPITTQRSIVEHPPSSIGKSERITAAIDRDPGDVVTDAIAEAGRVTSRAVDTTPAGDRTFVSWTPPRTTPTGPAAIHIEGQDVFGNTFETTVGPFEIQPMDIHVDTARNPSSVVERGDAARFEAELTFEDGVTMRPAFGDPGMVVRNAQGTVVDEGTGLFSQGRWLFVWNPPPDVPEGRYVIEVTGRDSAGNNIEVHQSASFQVVSGTVTAEALDVPLRVERGELVTGTMELPSQPDILNATFTTGTEELGKATIDRIENRTVHLSFPTDRSTSLVQAHFALDGRDVHGNQIDGETRNIQLDPILMRINWITSPPVEAARDGPIVAEFTITYPDGTRMHPGQGTPLVGLFQRGQSQGLIEAVEPREDDPTVWRVEWEPPDDIVTETPYTFAASAIDIHQNEATPQSSRGFFITNPTVPDYMPVPGPGPLLVLLGLLSALGLHRIQRSRR